MQHLGAGHILFRSDSSFRIGALELHNVAAKRPNALLSSAYRRNNKVYTTFTNMKYLVMCKIFSDVGGKK